MPQTFNPGGIVPSSRRLLDCPAGVAAIPANQNGIIFTNAGATGDVTFTLPKPWRGGYFGFLVVANDQELAVLTNDTIVISGSFVASVANNRQGNYMELLGVNDEQWAAYIFTGTWA